MLEPLRSIRRLVVLLPVVLLVSCGQSAGTPPDFADLVAKVSPSVVNISAIGDDLPATGSSTSAPDVGPDSGSSPDTPQWLRKFLDRAPANGASSAPPASGDGQGDGQGGDDGVGPDQPQSLGSGFILSSDGDILTNEHVVDGASEIIVRLSDGRQFPARVIGSDRRSDLALLKIDATGLPAVHIGSDEALRVGQWVLAIGSPFGFDYSVTAGIVSAKGRILDSEPYVPFIQTDAAINPGNSGGPLFNMRGQVVGVNSQIYSQTGGFMGLAFAVPIDLAMNVVHAIKTQGYVRRGWLGVEVQEVSRQLARSFGLHRPRGALIARVMANGPAQQSGLRVGDIILSFDGQPLQTSRDLPPLVGNRRPGQMVDLKVLRNGHRIDLRVQVGSLPGEKHHRPPPKPKPGALQEAPPPSLGIEVRALDDKERSVDQIAHGGVRVVSVSAGAAHAAGIVAGDIILSVDGQAVDSGSALRRAIARLTPGQTVPILIQRDGGPLFVALQVPRRR
jgi:periplasmic serine protease, Do/DeqQ family